MSKYSHLAHTLKASPLSSTLQWHVPPFPKPGIFIDAHDATYVDQVYRFDVPESVEKLIGFPVTEAVAHRALFATSGTLLAAELALKQGIAGNLAGGSHHAQFNHGAGFCTLNDVAVAATCLLKDNQIENAVILDLDVHQGDGAAAILQNWPQLKTVSLHCQQNYPFRKATSDVDVALEAGMENDEYLSILEKVLDREVIHASPDIVFYNAGVDIHHLDRLGKLLLDDDGIYSRDHMGLATLLRHKIPVCFVIGGGYSRNIDLLAKRHALVFGAAQSLICDQ